MKRSHQIALSAAVAAAGVVGVVGVRKRTDATTPVSAEPSDSQGPHAAGATDGSDESDSVDEDPPWEVLVQQSTTGTVLVDRQGVVSFASDTIERMLGHPVDQLVGNTLEWVCHSNDFQAASEELAQLHKTTELTTEFEIRAFDTTATTHILSVVASDMHPIDGTDGTIFNVTDITGSRLMEDRFQYAAQNDPLTLLPNRATFLTDVEAAIRRASVNETNLAVGIINIDDFRVINEGYGAEIADQVLIAFALRIRQAISQDAILSRLGGDEFGILLANSADEAEARHAIQEILDVLNRPIWVEGQSISVQSSAGLIVTDDTDSTAQSMLRKSSTALDSAKALDRGHIATFNDAMGAKVAERAELRDMLRVALQKNELRLVYQPILDIDSGKIVSFEALARWTVPDRGPISPAIFIPIAEASNLINDLGCWALRTACNQVKEWEKAGLTDFTVTVNFSGKQLLDPDVTTKVDEILTESAVLPERITIEITESVLIDDTETISARFRELRTLGVGLAIDDFGTGFSSLSYLRRYEFDLLKIDRSFVVSLGKEDNQRDRDIVSAMIFLAQSLGAKTVAEGIEHDAEFDALRSLGCDRAQGFLFWKPIEAEDVERVLRQSNPALAA